MIGRNEPPDPGKEQVVDKFTEYDADDNNQIQESIEEDKSNDFTEAGNEIKTEQAKTKLEHIYNTWQKNRDVKWKHGDRYTLAQL